MAHLGKALDAVRKTEYTRLKGKDRSYIKGQKYTLLSHRENLSLDGKAALKQLLAANKRLNTATCWRKASGSCGTTKAKAGHDASSMNGENHCAGSG